MAAEQTKKRMVERFMRWFFVWGVTARYDCKENQQSPRYNSDLESFWQYYARKGLSLI